MLNGKLQKVDWTSVTGWARDTKAPGVPVALTVSIDGEKVGRVLANQYRPKLEKHGNKGHVGFTLRLGRGLAPDTRHQVEVCRESDGAPLPGSPWLLEPPADLDESMRAYIAQLVDQGGMGEARTNIEFLAGQAGKLLQRGADAATGKEARAACASMPVAGRAVMSRRRRPANMR